MALTPKSSAVLGCLLERPGQLVSKDELLDRVWPDAVVSDASVKVCVREIRRVLGDRVERPQYIATVHRRGYRFIADVTRALARAAIAAAPVPATAVSGARAALSTPLVGRGGALDALAQAVARAEAGERQTVFITGELGIGKTTLIDACAAAAAERGVAVARGRCLEHFGAAEAYLPLLDALARLCRGPHGAVLIARLRAHAPTWLAQMPWLLDDDERARLQHDIFGGTRERMLREIAEALDAAAAEIPLLLVLEDLHWSDPSTLDAITLLAQRPEPARLLVLATYRPIDAILDAHPVKTVRQRLAVQRQCGEIALELLGPADVDAYLGIRLAGAPPAGLAEVLHRRTDGNPLFMVTVVDELLASGRLAVTADGWRLREGLDAVAAALPESVRVMVEQQAERLAADDLALLEAAALARVEFPSAMVAAALDADPLAVEQRCERLARQAQWVRARGVAELADGAVSGRYRFTHGLYQSVLAQRVSATRRVRLHQRIGEWLERHAVEPAATELAMHFEQARDAPRAVHHLRVAARTATARCAHREALGELSRALALVERLAPAERAAARHAVLEQRGSVHRARGDVEAAVVDFDAWAASSRADGAGRDEVRALLALSGAWSLRDRARGLAYAEQALARSTTVGDADLMALASGVAAYWQARVHGWRASDAQASAAAIAAARRSGRPGVIAPYVGMHALFDNLRGDYARAASTAEEGMRLAEHSGDSFTHALCRYQQSWALLHLGDWGALLVSLDQALQSAARNEHRLWSLVFTLVLGLWEVAAGAGEVSAPRAAAALAEADAAGHEYGIALAQVLAGWTALSRGAVSDARAAFDALVRRADERPAAMEWLLRLPLHLGRGACALADGDRRGAEADAARVCALAAEPGEPTYLALGWCTRTGVAIAERRWAEAEAALGAAQDALAGARAPLAEWQVWMTRALLATARSRHGEARDCAARGVAVLEGLAASLDGVDGSVATALGVCIPDVQRSIRGLPRGALRIAMAGAAPQPRSPSTTSKGTGRRAKT